MMTKGSRKLTEKQVEKVEKLLKEGYSIEAVSYKTGFGKTVIRMIGKGEHRIQRRRLERENEQKQEEAQSQGGLKAECPLDDLNKLIETLEAAIILMNSFKVKGVENAEQNSQGGRTKQR